MGRWLMQLPKDSSDDQSRQSLEAPVRSDNLHKRMRYTLSDASDGPKEPPAQPLPVGPEHVTPTTMALREASEPAPSNDLHRWSCLKC
jgi:hypothetical protein